MAEEIRSFMEIDPVLRRYPEIVKEATINTFWVDALRRCINRKKGSMFTSPLSVRCVGEVRILPESIVELELRTLALLTRYRHTRVIVINRDSLD